MKTILLTVCLFLCYPLLSIAQSNQGSEKVSLSAEELEAFKTQAIKTVGDLGTYIAVMVDKANPIERRNYNVRLAVELFANADSNIVEVSSLKDPSKKNYKSVRKYLIAVRDLPYQSVEIKWFGIYLSSDFVLGKDGKYYGVASICQIFEGKTKGTDGKLSVISKDTTCKSIQLIVEKLECMDGLKMNKCWILKLGDIKVDEQRTK